MAPALGDRLSPVVLGRELAAGLILGLVLVIYALTYAALLFAGPLEPYLGYGVTATMIPAVIGALHGRFSSGSSFVSGPDGNTISVLASAVAAIAVMGLAPERGMHVALAVIFAASLVCAASFWVFSRPQLSSLMRYVPFYVMAGFLASAGWVMASGALYIIAGMPLTLDGVARFMDGPARPELAFGLAVAMTLLLLARRLSGTWLLTSVTLGATVLVHAGLANGLCAPPDCSVERWLFAAAPQAQWLPPWRLDLSAEEIGRVLELVPEMLVVAFVGVLTVVLSMPGLELNFRREFDLRRELRLHATGAALSGAAGGFAPVISIARTILNQRAGGGAVASGVAALVALAALLGAGHLVSLLPRAALGGLVLYLGLSMMRQWLWDLRRTASPLELAQVVLILAITARYGFVTSFGTGVLISCVLFAVNYSKVPLASLATTLAVFRSSVVRPPAESEVLAAQGLRTLVFRLAGYVFFGSASKLDALFRQASAGSIDAVVLDLSRVSGIDDSAVSVLQRALRRLAEGHVQFRLVAGASTRASLGPLAADTDLEGRVFFHDSLDQALEAAEDALLARCGAGGDEHTAFAFLRERSDLARFTGYLERRPVQRDEILCTEGDRSDEVFFVESGSFDVVKRLDSGGRVRLAKLRGGAMVGELAFCTGEPRSATIIATQASSVQVLHRPQLERMREEDPELAGLFDQMVIRSIASALARSNQLIAHLG